MKIGEVAKAAGVTVDTVRFYERRGVLPTPPREPSGYRRYTADAADRIRLAKSLQALGFTLEEIVDALRDLDDGEATCTNQRWRLEAVLARIDAKLAELHRVRHNVVTVLDSSSAGRCAFCGSAAQVLVSLPYRLRICSDLSLWGANCQMLIRPAAKGEASHVDASNCVRGRCRDHDWPARVGARECGHRYFPSIQGGFG